ncbi:heme oxygenase-like protein [Punctularia strigosozonata HHB-11173 SS5]|uniref:heme oxygenase-like protein n=1 Tax=Punctularia strigosozonata (strain HHB-11173) TaxID=741275 RepID=UPI0004417DB6|nr:heme oxygenase-like protein [Punctularia strigosozonata HHB-11173 SS5]EIN12870.1 heme oxygenase-like protein [Punctularia strigosozonata HHB-11173 SS5]
MATELDTSLPVSTLLRQATAAAHSTAEHSPGAGWLARGELDREEYIRFNFMLWAVYSTLEDALAKYSTNSVLAPIYNPAQLARTERLEADIAYLLETLPLPPSTTPITPASSALLLPRPAPDAWSTHPLYTAFLATPPAALVSYATRLSTLASSSSTAPLLLAHAYVRYLGDLSGGQVIRRRIVKAYDLPADSDSGSSFYAFGAQGDAGRAAGLGDMKRIKEAFRAGMDEGVKDDAELKRTLAQEANTAFALNTGLFDALQPPANASTLDAPEKELDGSLGVPLSPTISEGQFGGVFAGLKTKVADIFGFGQQGDVKA